MWQYQWNNVAALEDMWQYQVNNMATLEDMLQYQVNNVATERRDQAGYCVNVLRQNNCVNSYTD